MGRGGGTRDVTGLGGALLDWLTSGSAMAALGKVSLPVCASCSALIYCKRRVDPTLRRD
jgi:hypothetical protein